MSLGLLTTLRQRAIPVVLAISDEWPIYAHRLDPWTRATSRVPRAARLIERLTGLPSGFPDLDDIGPGRRQSTPIAAAPARAVAWTSTACSSWPKPAACTEGRVRVPGPRIAHDPHPVG
jgi:hypothetical protein